MRINGFHLLLSLTAIMKPAFSQDKIDFHSSEKDTAPRGSETAIDFTSADLLDKTGFATRDFTKPFYFFVNRSLAHSKVDKRPFTVDIGTVFDVWLDQDIPLRTDSSAAARSLALAITSQFDENVKDKIFFDAIPHASPEHLDIREPDTRHSLFFDFKLDPSYETPKFWVMHVQAFQCCSGHPPFTINVTPNKDVHSPIIFNFSIRNDDIEKFQAGKEQVIYRMIVPRGEWHNIELMLSPHVAGDNQLGEIEMRYDQKHEFSYKGNWGYKPRLHADADDHEVRSFLGFDLGIYRRRQKTTQTIYFANIRYSKVK